MFSGVAFWQSPTTAVIPGLTALDYGRWVMTRRNTLANQRAQWSNDGISWNLATTPNSYDYYACDFSPELGLYVAVASNAVTDNIMTSTNSVTWTSRSKSTDGGFGAITWCPGYNKFIAQSTGGSTASTQINLWASSNGTNWTQVFTASGYTWPGGFGWFFQSAYASTSFGNEFLAVYRRTSSGSASNMVYTTDGSSFTTYSLDRFAGFVTNIVYNSTLNRWILNEAEGPTTTTNVFASSQTASSESSWLRYTVTRAPASSLTFTLVANNDGRNGGTATPINVTAHLSGSNTTNPIRYSSTALTGSWTASTLPNAAYGFYHGAYSRALNQFVLARSNNANTYTSTTGITWTLRTTAATENVANVFGEGVRTNGYRVGGT